tara:strand:- start:86 stop:511 length:426 start_codon:yes stop_codon:yes gene_type:complete
METPEEWRIVKTHPNYEVSNKGRVRRIGAKKVLALTTTTGDYYKVNMFGSDAKPTQRVNRIVALAFLGEPPVKGMYCHHKNHNRKDNRVENLEWVTPEENSQAHIKWNDEKTFRVSLEREAALPLLKKMADVLMRLEKQFL